jgi:hypothetical protein
MRPANAWPTWPINSAVRRLGSRIMATIATTIIKANVSTLDERQPSGHRRF